MRVFFIGNVLFSRAMLETILGCVDVEVVGVTTKSASSVNTDHSDISDLAKANNIPFKYVKDINAPHIIDWIKGFVPDVIFCFGWSSLIRKELLKAAPLGVIGYHPSKLPKNRGRHPIIWALALGLKATGSTFFKMDSGADSGDIISQKTVSILEEDNAGSLYEKLSTTAKAQILEFIPLIANYNIVWKKQNQNMSNLWRKRGEKDGEIDFRMNSDTIYNLVRALTHPYVGAHVIYNEKQIKIWKTRICKSAPLNFESGKVLAVNIKNEICIKTADSSIWLVEHEFETLPTINSYIQ